jgi:hypothetical protein
VSEEEKKGRRVEGNNRSRQAILLSDGVVGRKVDSGGK